jgi:hypothetical protein
MVSCEYGFCCCYGSFIGTFPNGFSSMVCGGGGVITVLLKTIGVLV